MSNFHRLAGYPLLKADVVGPRFAIILTIKKAGVNCLPTRVVQEMPIISGQLTSVALPAMASLLHSRTRCEQAPPVPVNHAIMASTVLIPVMDPTDVPVIRIGEPTARNHHPIGACQIANVAKV